jgi:hypothetical protein
LDEPTERLFLCLPIEEEAYAADYDDGFVGAHMQWVPGRTPSRVSASEEEQDMGSSASSCCSRSHSSTMSFLRGERRNVDKDAFE